MMTERNSLPEWQTRHGAFPDTHWSILTGPEEAQRDPERRRRSFEALAALYWQPIYAYIRLRWNQSREEAEDLVQEFLLSIIEGEFLQRADPSRGRFRSFVRTHLDHFMSNTLRAGKRLRRGGGRKILPLPSDESLEETVTRAAALPPDQVLDEQWNRAVLREAVRRLKRTLHRESLPHTWEMFRRYDLDEGPPPRPSYSELARSMGLNVSDVTNGLARARRHLYSHVRDIIAESVDGNESLRQELEQIFGRRRPGAS